MKFYFYNPTGKTKPRNYGNPEGCYIPSDWDMLRNIFLHYINNLPVECNWYPKVTNG